MHPTRGKDEPRGEHARIEHSGYGGYVVIDVDAWLERRTGGPIEELTGDLHQWADTHPSDELTPAEQDSWGRTARAWCEDGGSEPAEALLIAHVETRLDAEVWIVRTTAPGWGPVA